MRIKRKNGLKMIVIALVLLLCLALAVGITGAYYQAKRQATGTLNMDQGIIIDYKGFNKGDENIWQREKESTFLLFSETDAQPGEHIAVNAAGIRANTESVDFYARVKLSYKFYNGETPVELADATKLIKTSSSFWTNSWVDGGSSDGYYYYATGTTLNKFNKDTQTFVDLFATNAEFVIEGENFTGATSDGEGGGFVVGDTSINKIAVYLTLETLQGDADAAAEGWKIASEVDFSKVNDNATFVRTGNYTEGATLSNYTDTAEIEEMQNVEVTINDKISPLKEIKFKYGEKTILEFDSPNVEYIQLNYKSGKSSEKFYDKQETGNAKIAVTADDNEEVVGYVVGWFSSKEYTGFVYSNRDYSKTGSPSSVPDEGGFYDESLVENFTDGKMSIVKYFGEQGDISVPDKQKMRERKFRVVYTKDYIGEWSLAYDTYLQETMYPVTVVETGKVCKSRLELINEFYALPDGSEEMTLEGTLFVNVGALESIVYSERTIDQILPLTFGILPATTTLTSLNIPGGVKIIGNHMQSGSDNHFFTIFGVNGSDSAGGNPSIKSITIGEGITTILGGTFYGCELLENISLPSSINFIGDYAFKKCYSLSSITIPDSVTSIGREAFHFCSSLTSIVLPEGIKEIPFSCFSGCSGLTSITIPDSVTSISNFAFSGCSFTSITIPDNVASIGSYAFRCNNLTTTIGEGWVKASDNTAVDAGTLLKDITYDIKRA